MPGPPCVGPSGRDLRRARSSGSGRPPRGPKNPGSREAQQGQTRSQERAGARCGPPRHTRQDHTTRRGPREVGWPSASVGPPYRPLAGAPVTPAALPVWVADFFSSGLPGRRWRPLRRVATYKKRDTGKSGAKGGPEGARLRLTPDILLRCHPGHRGGERKAARGPRALSAAGLSPGVTRSTGECGERGSRGGAGRGGVLTARPPRPVSLSLPPAFALGCNPGRLGKRGEGGLSSEAHPISSAVLPWRLPGHSAAGSKPREPEGGRGPDGPPSLSRHPSGGPGPILGDRHPRRSSASRCVAGPAPSLPGEGRWGPLGGGASSPRGGAPAPPFRSAATWLILPVAYACLKD